MTIITDTKSLHNILNLKIPAKIQILCKENEAFPAEAVKTMLSLKAEMVTIPENASYEFAFGIMAGKLKPADTVVISDDPALTSSAAAFGLQTEVKQPKTRKMAKNGTPTRKRRKPATKITEEEKPKDPVKFSMPEPIEEEANGADRTVSPKFSALVRKLGVHAEDIPNVHMAVFHAAEYISYELQLRLRILDAEKAKTIYDQTKDRFSDLKALA